MDDSFIWKTRKSRHFRPGVRIKDVPRGNVKLEIDHIAFFYSEEFIWFLYILQTITRENYGMALIILVNVVSLYLCKGPQVNIWREGRTLLHDGMLIILFWTSVRGSVVSRAFDSQLRELGFLSSCCRFGAISKIYLHIENIIE